MTKLFLLIAALVPLVISPWTVYGFSFGGNETPKVVVATINGEDVSKADVEMVLNQLAEQRHAQNIPSYDTLKDEQKLALLKEVALKRLLAKEVTESGITNERKIKDKLAAIEKELVQNEFVARKAKEAVTPEKIKARYDQTVANLQGKEEFKVRHILVESEDEANALSKQLTHKASAFEQLAKEHSKDSSSKNGGELGYIVQGNAPPEFEQAALQLKVGAISKPVKTSLGWHIIQLEDRRKATIVPFDQAKDTIEQQLAQLAMQDYFKKLVSGAKIELATK